MSEDQNISENENTSLDERENKTALPTETAMPKQTETVSSPPVNENLEVHHHPHLHYKKKHLREYFFEFLMIFLAVTLGFFAENLRENITEDAKAKGYAQSLYSDLKEDTSYLNFILQYKMWRGLKIDSLISILSSEDIQKSANLIYYYHYNIETNIPFTPADVTIQQLRNSGGLRYFKSPQLYNAITKYDGGVTFYKEQEKDGIGRVSFNLSAKIFRAAILGSMVFMAKDPRDAIRIPVGTPRLLTIDKQILNEYLLYIISKKHENEVLLILLHSMVEKNMNKLMQTLQNEYKLH